MKIEQFQVLKTSGLFQTNSYVFKSIDKWFVVDPGSGIFSSLMGLVPVDTVLQVLLTHAHYDHIAGLVELTRIWKIQLFVSREDAPLLKDPDLNFSRQLGNALVIDYEWLNIDEHFETVAAPGHTPGSRVIIFDGHVFTGDVVFSNTIGRWDLCPLQNAKWLMNETIRKLTKLFKSLPNDWLVLPGHGEIVTVSGLFTLNPFFKR